MEKSKAIVKNVKKAVKQEIKKEAHTLNQGKPKNKPKKKPKAWKPKNVPKSANMNIGTIAPIPTNYGQSFSFTNRKHTASSKISGTFKWENVTVLSTNTQGTILLSPLIDILMLLRSRAYSYAKIFEFMDINKLEFEYRGASSTNRDGRFVMGIDPEPGDNLLSEPADYEIGQFVGSKTFSPFIPTTTMRLGKAKGLRISKTDVSSSARRFEAAGRFYLAIDSAVAPNITYGSIYVHYDLKFYGPVLESSHYDEVLYRNMAFNPTITVTNNTVNSCDMKISDPDSRYIFDFANPGVGTFFLLCHLVSGSSITGALSATTTTANVSLTNGVSQYAASGTQTVSIFITIGPTVTDQRINLTLTSPNTTSFSNSVYSSIYLTRAASTVVAVDDTPEIKLEKIEKRFDALIKNIDKNLATKIIEEAEARDGKQEINENSCWQLTPKVK